MSLSILIAFALATTIPCVGLWAADQRDRHQRSVDALAAGGSESRP